MSIWLCSIPVWAFSFLVEQSEPASLMKQQSAWTRHAHEAGTSPCQPLAPQKAAHSRWKQAAHTSLTRLPSLPQDSSGRHSPGEKQRWQMKTREGWSGSNSLSFPALTRATKVTTVRALAQDSFHNDRGLPSVRPCQTTYVNNGPHFYLVLTAHRGPPHAQAYLSLSNNPVKQVVLVLTALAAFCFSERRCQVALCVWC